MGEAIHHIQKRNKARQKLLEVANQAEHVVVIHYSCESFYDRTDGTSPRITSIAVLNLEDRQATSFSIHQIAERQGIAPAQIEAQYDDLERLMLQEFYEYVRVHLNYIWLHWNMRNVTYGFQALAHRCKVLGGQPVELHDSKLVDLAHLLIAIYGTRYVGHPRLQKLLELNKISMKDFLTGAEEAEAFEQKDYVKLHQSTLRKADMIASIAERTSEGRLQTHATFRDIYGSYPAALGEILREHWLVALIGFISAIVGIVALFFS